MGLECPLEDLVDHLKDGDYSEGSGLAPEFGSVGSHNYRPVVRGLDIEAEDASEIGIDGELHGLASALLGRGHQVALAYDARVN